MLVDDFFSVFVFKVKRVNDDDGDDNNYMEKCTICLSEFEDEEDVR